MSASPPPTSPSCPSCGAAARQGDRFCGRCGAPLQPGSFSATTDPAGERTVALPLGDASATAPLTPELVLRPAADTAAFQMPELSEGRAGRYLLGQEIGRGGMGIVRLALDQDLKRTVALKVLKKGKDSPEGTLRFLEEMQATSQLEHPSIVPVYDVGRLGDGAYFYTMRLIGGETLKQVLAAARERAAAGIRDATEAWSLHRLVSSLEQVAQAVEYAHRRGVIHRDIKPENIMLGSHGEALLMDWGIAIVRGDTVRTLRGAPSGGSGSHLEGTLPYMAPEQASGTVEPDERADVYSLGATLYEILCLEPPFHGDHAVQVLMAVVEGRYVRPGDHPAAAGAPTELLETCNRAMAHDRHERTASAAAFARELRRFLDGAQERARRRALCDEALEAAREARSRMEAGRREVEELEARTSEEAARVMPWEPPERKARLWELERELAEQRRTILRDEGGMVQALTVAHGHAPGDPRPRSALADYYWRLLQAAEDERDDARALYLMGLVAAYDDGARASELAGTGAIELDSNPAGTEILLHRFEERGRVLVPLPLADAAGARAPLERTVPMGSYLAVLRHPGFRDVRYPLRIRRGERHRASVRLLRADEVPEDMVYVPAGPFVFGGDRTAKEPVRQILDLPAFLIGRHGVTCEEYAAFLEDLRRSSGAAAAEQHVPRMGHSGEPRWRPDDAGRYAPPAAEGFLPRAPIFSISWHDAVAYAAWRTLREGRTYRLPTEREWEKAARGTDGRYYPWGDDFDATFCNNIYAHDGPSAPEPVEGRPQDESPYGVRGMAGNIHEWCSSWYDPRQQYRCIRGGVWSEGSFNARCAWRGGAAPDLSIEVCGLRLAADVT